MQVAIVEKRWVSVRKAARERLAKCQQENLCPACLEPLADDEPRMRGVHIRCYHATRRAIQAGKFTEQERVQAGKLLEPSSTGRPPSNPVSVEAN
jgi:hypothetical protein